MNVVYSPFGTEISDGPMGLVDYPGDNIITLVQCMWKA